MCFGHERIPTVGRAPKDHGTERKSSRNATESVGGPSLGIPSGTRDHDHVLSPEQPVVGKNGFISRDHEWERDLVRITSQKIRYLKIAVYRMKADSSRDAMRVEKRTSFPPLPESDDSGSTRRARDESASEQSLQVNNEVEMLTPQRGSELS